jgi:RNA polymerase sporulation-specific sigma factor
MLELDQREKEVMASLPNPEALTNPDKHLVDRESADVIDIQEYIQEQRPKSILGSVAVAETQVNLDDAATKVEFLHYTDRKRIEAARNDPASFAALMDEYTGLIRHMANGYFLNGGSMEDLMQEAMFGFYKSVRDYDGLSSSFKTFAELCMRRQLITTIKKANRLKHEPLNEYVSFSHTPANQNGDGEGLTFGDTLPARARLPEDLVIGNETFEGLIDILSSELSYLEYSALKMYLEGHSYEIMAEELAEDTKTIDNALQRVKRKILEYQRLESNP